MVLVELPTHVDQIPEVPRCNGDCPMQEDAQKKLNSAVVEVDAAAAASCDRRPSAEVADVVQAACETKGAGSS